MLAQHTLATRPAGPTVELAQPPPLGRAAWSNTPVDARRALRRILVATDGTAASRGALTVGALLARRDGAAVDVLNVLERWGPPNPDPEMWDVFGDLIADRLSRVMPQAEALFGGLRGWTVSIVDGGVASTISEVGNAEAYDLLVVGLRRRWIDRVLRRFTSLAVARRSAVPVLAVPPTVTALPTRAVIGLDGVARGSRAARLAMNLLHAPAFAHLLHVQTVNTLLAHGAVDADAMLARVERELDRCAGVSIERTVVEDSEPAAGLVAHATALGADLIAVATRKPMSLTHRLVGGVSRRVLRSAECSVLLGSGG